MKQLSSIKQAQNRAKIDQLQYHYPKQIIQDELDFRQVERQTEIWIYPKYPRGFRGVVGAHDRVYIFEVELGSIVSIDAKPVRGVRPNGSLIF